MNVVIRREQYSSHFKPVLESEHRYLVLFGGRGSGKTNHIILKLLALTYLHEHIHIVYCRNEKTTIRDTTFQDIYNYIENSPMKGDFEYSKAYNSSMIFTNKFTGKKLVPFGLTDEENTKGISEATHVWIDEVNKCSQSAVAMINSVLRTPKARILQLIVSFNPVDTLHWLRTFFFDEDNDYLPNSRFGDSIFLHHSTVDHNEYIDVDEYKNTLRLNYSHNQNLLDVNLFGKWGQAEVDKPYINTFKMKEHVGQFSFDNSDILLSFDFNVDPMTCTASQMQKGKVVIVEEYKRNNSWTEELCQYILPRLPRGNNIFITGDASGKNRQSNVRGGLNSYHTIQDVFKLSDYAFHLPKANNEVKGTRELVQKAFYRDLILINETCTNLINDLLYVEADMYGKMVKKTTGTGKELSHFMDNLGYSIANYWVKHLNL